MSLTGSYATNKFSLEKQWFDYTPEMNAIMNTLDQRLLNLEIVLQTNNQIVNRSHTIIDHNLSNSDRNKTENLSQQSLNLTLEQQLHKLNLSPHPPFEGATIDYIDPSINSLHTDKSKDIPSSNLTSNQLKTRAFEFTAIFEDAFDQLNIIHNVLPVTNNNASISTSDNPNCNPFTLNLAGIFIMNEDDKFRYEIKYFFHLLMFFYRALLLNSPTDFRTTVEDTYNQLPSQKLSQLNNRLKESQEKIVKLSSNKTNFQHSNNLDSTKSQLKDLLMEETYRSKIALRYSNNWKTNHIFQWIQMLLQIENDSKKTVDQYENILKQTEFRHRKTIEFLTKQRDDMKNNADQWYDHYQNETTRFEKELIDFRYEFNQIKNKRQDMYEEYQRMKSIVDEYNQMKINEKLLLDKQKREEEAIQSIQSWWRGTMTRHVKQKKRKKKKKQKNKK